MTQPVTVRVYDIVGGPLCVSTEDGQRLHDKIFPLLNDGTPIALSFDRVETLVSAFLNTAIGQLYGKLTEDRLRELLSVKDMDRNDLVILKRVVDNAKLYVKHPDDFDRAWQEELDDEEDTE